MTPRKRFLVIVRAGDSSLHPRWTHSLATRDWDLVVSYFGNDPHCYRDGGVIRIDDMGPKYPALHTLLNREDFWRGYDYIWLPDDDLAVSQGTISSLFEVTASHDFALTQPALSWLSWFSHAVTIQHPSFKLRLTNFVEIMAPCFERRFLETCLPTMGENLSGWGLDWVWPRLLTESSPRVAIIDDVTVTHTRRPGGPNYATLRASGISPHAEMESLLRKYGISLPVASQVFAAIDHEGHVLNGTDPAGATRMAELLRCDWRDFLISRQSVSMPKVILPAQPQRWR